ncbi:MAG: SHOCT domain-containing protein [Rikenellaceae bacterium]
MEKIFKSSYLLRFIHGDWWFCGNTIIVDSHCVEFRKRDWHLLAVDTNTFHWESMYGITIDNHIFGSTIVVKTKKEDYRFGGFSKSTARQIRELATEYLSLNSQRGSIAHMLSNSGLNLAGGGVAPAPQVSVADELVKLKSLYDDGTISESEYVQLKSKLLS